MNVGLPLAVDGGVAGHGLRGGVVVGVGAVQEGLPALALGERGVEHQPRTRLRIHGTAAWRGPVLRIEAEEESGKWLRHNRCATAAGRDHEKPKHTLECVADVPERTRAAAGSVLGM